MDKLNVVRLVGRLIAGPPDTHILELWVRLKRTLDWSQLLKSDELNLDDGEVEARQDDDQRKSIVQQVLQISTDFLRQIIAPVQGREA